MSEIYVQDSLFDDRELGRSAAGVQPEVVFDRRTVAQQTYLNIQELLVLTRNLTGESQALARTSFDVEGNEVDGYQYWRTVFGDSNIHNGMAAVRNNNVMATRTNLETGETFRVVLGKRGTVHKYVPGISSGGSVSNEELATVARIANETHGLVPEQAQGCGPTRPSLDYAKLLATVGIAA